jgi:hypothetical protein
MKIGDEAFVHGYVDEIRKDTIIIRNNGGYFGTDISEVICGSLPERKTGHWIPQDHNHTHGNVSTCIYFSPVCSEYGHTGDFNMDFCPNCGAKMGVEHDTISDIKNF